MHANRRFRPTDSGFIRRLPRGLAVVVAVATALATAGARATDAPTFVDGQAQVVEAFSDARLWIREVLWVETEFDSDGDGARDRMHVDVTRPSQTEGGLKVAVIYETSPYFAAVAAESPKYVWCTLRRRARAFRKVCRPAVARTRRSRRRP